MHKLPISLQGEVKVNKKVCSKGGFVAKNDTGTALLTHFVGKCDRGTFRVSHFISEHDSGKV